MTSNRQISKVVRWCRETPWAITPHMLQVIADVIDRRAAGVLLTEDEILMRIGGRKSDGNDYRIVGDTAIIDVHGVVGKRMNLMHEISGGVSTELLQSQLSDAADNREVRRIVLDIDSPGGAVDGVRETAKTVAEIARIKPVVAMVNDMAASAAYWIASGASEIVTTETGMSGSIGVYTMHTDTSKADEQRGITRTVVKAGAHKAAGMLPITEDVRADMQQKVDDIMAMFSFDVATHRHMSPDEVKALEARTYMGQRAIDAGLADRMGTLEGVMSRVDGGKSAKVTVQVPSGGKPMADEIKETTAVAEPPKVDAEAIRRQERERIASIRERAKALGIVDDTFVSGLVDSGVTVEGAKAKMSDYLAERNPPATPALPVGTNVAQADKFGAVATQALSLKIFGHSPTYSYENPADLWKDQDYRKKLTGTWLRDGERISGDAMQMSRRPLVALAAEALEQCGIRNAHRLPPQTIARLAMSSPMTNPQAWAEHAGQFLAGDVPLHSPSHFPAILKDAMNKRQRMGFEVAPTTYQIWARQAPSVSDFKLINRPLLGEASDLEQISANQPRFPEQTFTDHNQSYRVARYGKKWSVGVEVIVNDDLNALSVIPMRLGIGARQTLNRFIYAFLTANAAIDTGSGSGDLFNTTALTTAGGHKNDYGAGAPSVAVLNSVYTNMALQKGLNSDALLNIGFRYLIAPQALRGTVLQLLQSTSNPTNTAGATEDATRPNFNSGTTNIWQNAFIPVFDGNLDSNSASAYYFAAEPMMVDTIEYCFLSGFESPVVEMEYDFETKGQMGTIEWDFGGAVLDHRGLHRAGV